MHDGCRPLAGLEVLHAADHGVLGHSSQACHAANAIAIGAMAVGAASGPAAHMIACLAAGLMATSFGAAAQTAPEHVRSWAAGCANCHGTNGRAEPGNESLAGANKDEMVKKMLDFKSGRRPATLMHQLAKGYSDEQIIAIAGYFAAQKK